MQLHGLHLQIPLIMHWQIPLTVVEQQDFISFLSEEKVLEEVLEFLEVVDEPVEDLVEEVSFQPLKALAERAFIETEGILL